MQAVFVKQTPLECCPSEMSLEHTRVGSGSDLGTQTQSLELGAGMDLSISSAGLVAHSKIAVVECRYFL